MSNKYQQVPKSLQRFTDGGCQAQPKRTKMKPCGNGPNGRWRPSNEKGASIQHGLDGNAGRIDAASCSTDGIQPCHLPNFTVNEDHGDDRKENANPKGYIEQKESINPCPIPSFAWNIRIVPIRTVATLLRLSNNPTHGANMIVDIQRDETDPSAKRKGENGTMNVGLNFE